MIVTKESVVKASKYYAKESPRLAKEYVLSLFPIANWIGRYNRTWLLGDVIAGLSVGSVIIPQALAFSRLAGVPLEYGLYTSFVGTFVYCLFATSKDVTIGATAVLSQLVGQLYATYGKGTDPVLFGSALAVFSGLISLAIGLLRLGIVVELISVPVVYGFMTGAGLQIIFGQISSLLGIRNINTNDSPYLVLYNTLSNISKTSTDAYFGIASVLLLVAFRLTTRYAVSKGHKWFIWVGFAANLITFVSFTLVSWAIYSKVDAAKIPIRIVGNIPKGLKVVPFTKLSFSDFLSPTLSVLLVGIIEHIGIGKAFARLNGYKIDPNQEIIAFGITNVIASFFGGFPATGSFSRTSIKSRSGVQSPLAGLVTGAVVLSAIFFLTPAFYFIPSATLAGIIVVAITDLLARPHVFVRLWNTDFFDFMAFLTAIILTVFANLEVGIFASVGLSLAVLLVRIAYPKVLVLVREDEGAWVNSKDVSKRGGDAETPYPGIPVIRVEESITYPSSSKFVDIVKDWFQANTKTGRKSDGEVPSWSSDLHRRVPLDHGNAFGREKQLAPLRAIVFDFSAVNSIDSTGLQALVDLRGDAEFWAANQVPFFFSQVSPNVRRKVESFLKESHPEVVSEFGEAAVPGKFIFGSIDDAVANAAEQFKFGNISSATIV